MSDERVSGGDEMIFDERTGEATTEATASRGSAAGRSETRKSGKSQATGAGLTVRRHFTRPGVDPFDTVEWELRSATIANEKGETVFEQTDVEIPKRWSQLATNVVVSKYSAATSAPPNVNGAFAS